MYISLPFVVNVLKIQIIFGVNIPKISRENKDLRMKMGDKSIRHLSSTLGITSEKTIRCGFI